MEAQFNPAGFEDVARLSYSNDLSDGYGIVPTGGHGHGNVTDSGLAGAEQGQQADTPQLGIGEQTSECGVPPTAINCLDRPESSRGKSTMVVAQRSVRDLPSNAVSSAFYEDSVELPVASLPWQHFGHRFEMDGKVEDWVPMTTDLGSGESASEDKTCLSNQEWRAFHTAQSSSIRPKIQKAKESENYPNHISFKLPVVRIPDAEFFGFSFSPRFEEKSRSLRTQELKPTLNPFENIERQGRCSPLNHSQSPPDSRHHSRSSTVGLQAFRPFPSAMKTSKETGDRPPVIPSPPLLPGTTSGEHGSIGGVKSLTVGAKHDSTRRDELCLGPKNNTEGAFRANVSKLFLWNYGSLECLQYLVIGFPSGGITRYQGLRYYFSRRAEIETVREFFHRY